MRANNTDIDLDFGNREEALKHLQRVRASTRRNDGMLTRHASGVYFTDIPHDIDGYATIDYKTAEERGYFKVDFLNVSVYEQVKDETHLTKLMTTEPPWHRLLEREFCERLIHVGNYWSMICSLPEPINSIPRLSMFIAMIRPGKKHLIGQPWSVVAKSIWDKTDDGYTFKKSHSLAYAHLIVVNMNLLVEQGL